jgi:hypothetical protein
MKALICDFCGKTTPDIQAYRDAVFYAISIQPKEEYDVKILFHAAEVCLTCAIEASRVLKEVKEALSAPCPLRVHQAQGENPEAPSDNAAPPGES